VTRAIAKSAGPIMCISNRSTEALTRSLTGQTVTMYAAM